MSTQPTLIRIDLNNPEFQQQLFTLTKEQQRSVLMTLRKLSGMTWNQVYQDAGLNWEAIRSKKGVEGQKLCSLRTGKGFRAVGYREGDWLRLASLHPDHDSAYE
ncbi:MAG TPA: hypothetical protein VKM72_17465 [Thermoanaerobaculia bacterium]|nr:hypothetical protein [Thermoanaerobaculia bacterium]